MKNEYFKKVQKLICIFFIGLICFASAGIISYAEETIYEGPESTIPMHDDEHVSPNNVYYQFFYTMELQSYYKETGTADYIMSQYFKVYCKNNDATCKNSTIPIYDDIVYLTNRLHKDEKMGTFDDMTGDDKDPGYTYYRNNRIKMPLVEGKNEITIKGQLEGSTSGDAYKVVNVRKFNNPPTITGTDGTWMEGEVTSGKRTWQSLYTDGATGSVEGNKKQTSTGFMYYDKEDAPGGVNAYSDNILGKNSYINKIVDETRGITYVDAAQTQQAFKTMNNPGTYRIYTYTTDSGAVKATGSRKITVKDDLNPTIKTVNRTFYQDQYTASQWQNTLRWKDTTATDPEDGNLTSNITIKSDNVKVNEPGTYQVIYTVTDSIGQTSTATSTVTVKFNNPPTVTAPNREFYEGQYTDDYWKNTLRWKDVAASDKEDTPGTTYPRDRIKIKSDNVKVSTPGTYYVEYEVTDNFGKTTIKKVTVTVKYNNPPVIVAPNREFYEGQYTDDYWKNTLRWKDVAASDKEDTPGTTYPRDRIKIKSDNVKVSTPGTYYVEYQVTDNFGKTTIKKVTVKVKYNNPPVVTAEDRWFFEDEDVTNARLLERAKATDIEDGNITSKIIITENTVQNHVIGDYKVTYKVTDAYGKSDSERVNIHIVKKIPTGDEYDTYLRFISKKYIDTLKPNSIWRTPEYAEILNNTLNKTDRSQAKEHWHLTNEDIEKIKKFNETHTWSQESNQEFLREFGYLRVR